MPSTAITPFDKYDRKVRDLIIKLALVKPPKDSCKRKVKKHITSVLKEYDII